MIWLLYIIVGGVSGVLGSVIARLFTKNDKIINIITLVFIFLMLGLTNKYVVPYYEIRDLEKTIRSNPVFELIAKDSPADFNAYLETLKNLVKSNPSENDAFYITAQTTGQFIDYEVRKYSQKASNKSLYNYAEATLNFYKHLLNVDPILILYIEFPDKFKGNTDRKKMEQYLEKYKNYLDIIANSRSEIIKSAIENPQPPLTDDDIKKVDAIFGEIILNLVKKYGKENVGETFYHPESPSLNKQTAASIVVETYQEIVSRGENTGGVIMKYILKPSNQNPNNQSSGLIKTFPPHGFQTALTHAHIQ